MKYENEFDLRDVLEKFENGTISRKAWGHPEHLIVAYFYLSENDFETAADKMRAGIFGLLKAFKVDLEKEMPYHETLTIFWLKTVSEFARQNEDLPLIEKIDKLIRTFDKNYPLKFYPEEILFSAEARKFFVAPVLKTDSF